MEAEPVISTPDPDRNAAFETFWDAHYEHCVVMLMAIGATLDDAHDTVGDVMANMLDKDTLARLTSPRAWVRKAVLHRYYDRRGHERHRLERERGTQASSSYLDRDLNTWEDWQWVQQELSRLPPTQRSVFELVIAEFDTKEIADLLGKTPTLSGKTSLTAGSGLERTSPHAIRAQPIVRPRTSGRRTLHEYRRRQLPRRRRAPRRDRG